MNVFSKFHSDFTDNVLGYSALGIILSTCLGSAAVFSVLHFGHGMTQMLIVMLTVILCSTHNAAILTVQKPELIFKTYVSLIELRAPYAARLIGYVFLKLRQKAHKLNLQVLHL